MSSIIHSNATVGVGQLDVSNQRRLPVDDMVTNNVQSVSAEAIQYYYYASGVLTQDAGQAAGTIVVAKLANTQILNSLGDTVGTYGDTSFSFGTGTVLVSAQQKPFRGVLAELAEVSGLNSTLAASARATAVTQGFLRGDWCIDHEHGVIYGVKATTGTTDTGSYKVNAPGGGGSVAENVNIAKVGGAATAAAAALADATANPTVGSFGSYTETYNGTTWDRARGGQTSNSATVTGMANVLSMARYDSSPTARTTGQFGNLQADANGDLQTNLATLISGEDQTNGVLATVVKPLAVNTYASTKTQSNSFTTTNLKGAPGTLLGFRVINTTASTRYLQFHNTATTPGGGATAQEKWLIPANGSLTIGSADLPINGLYFSTGIAYANSTVNSTYTAGSAGDLLLDVNFI